MRADCERDGVTKYRRCNTTRIYVRARIAFNRPYASLRKLISLSQVDAGEKVNALLHKSFGVRETRYRDEILSAPLPSSLVKTFCRQNKCIEAREEKKRRKGISVAKNCSFLALWPIWLFSKNNQPQFLSRFFAYLYVRCYELETATANIKALLLLAMSELEFRCILRLSVEK